MSRQPDPTSENTDTDPADTDPPDTDPPDTDSSNTDAPHTDAPDTDNGDDLDLDGEESFPASDPPAHWMGEDKEDRHI